MLIAPRAVDRFDKRSVVLHRVNEACEVVHRPFGIRLLQIINEVQHPLGVEALMRSAFEEAFEQEQCLTDGALVPTLRVLLEG